jgi:hypothetical protein
MKSKFKNGDVLWATSIYLDDVFPVEVIIAAKTKNDVFRYVGNKIKELDPKKFKRVRLVAAGKKGGVP